MKPRPLTLYDVSELGHHVNHIVIVGDEIIEALLSSLTCPNNTWLTKISNLIKGQKL